MAESDTYSGRSFVEGRMFYCNYRVIRDGEGRRMGAVVAGRSIEELIGNTRSSALNSLLAVSVIILYTFSMLLLFVGKRNHAIKRTENYLNDVGRGEYPEEPLMIAGGDELSKMAEVVRH